MNEYKSIDKYLKNANQKKKKINNKKFSNTIYKKYFFSFLYKSLTCLILFLSFLILTKYNSKCKGIIYEKVYNNFLSFANIRNFYDEHFGSIFPSSKIFPSEVMVFNETITYKDAQKYKDGVVLTTDSKYLVPLIKSGVVIYIGNKEDYGDTVIIQGEDENIWYCNINISDVKLYDYLEKGSYIGEAKDEKIYLIFEKNGEYLDYKEFI